MKKFDSFCKQFGEEYFNQVDFGLKIFNQQKYWECHEALEDPWYEDINHPLRDLVWAIIQIAAALVHYENNNLIGAVGLLEKAKQKINRTDLKKIDHKFLNSYLDLNNLINIINKIGPEMPVNSFIDLYNFRFPLKGEE